MKFIPHNYQKAAIKFIEEHREAALLLDCGLGKTAIALTAINNLIYDSFEIHKVLVIAPLRVTRVWADEIQKWEHLRRLTYSVAVGSASERLKALQRKSDIYIINAGECPLAMRKLRI